MFVIRRSVATRYTNRFFPYAKKSREGQKNPNIFQIADLPPTPEVGIPQSNGICPISFGHPIPGDAAQKKGDIAAALLIKLTIDHRLVIEHKFL